MNAIYVIDTIVNIAGPIGCIVCAVKAHKRHNTYKHFYWNSSGTAIRSR